MTNKATALTVKELFDQLQHLIEMGYEDYTLRRSIDVSMDEPVDTGVYDIIHDDEMVFIG